MNLLKTPHSKIKSLLKAKNKPYLIAIGSMCKGAGATHTAILIGNSLRRLGIKTAILECNDSLAFSNLEKVLGYEVQGNSFSFKGVKFYKNVDKYTIDNITEEGFNAIILDLSYPLKSFREYFNQADLPIVVCRFSDWKIEDFSLFLDDHTEILSKRVKYLALYAKNSELSALKHKYARDFSTFPFVRDPFIKDKNAEEYVYGLF